MGERSGADGATLAAFAGVVVVGGANFVAVKSTVEELDPLFGAAARFALAALVFFAILKARGVPLPRGRALAGAAIYGVLGFGAAYALAYTALVELSVGVAAVLMATAPVFTLALASLQGLERLTFRGSAGAAIAVGGIAVLSAHSLAGDVPIAYLFAGLSAPIVIAQSAVVAKRFPQTDPVATNAVGMSTGAALLAVASLFAGEAWTIPSQGETWAATAWLVVAGSVALFWLFLFVIQRWTASASTYALPLMPVVAVGLAALLQGERVGLEEVAGGLLVLVGVYVGVLLPERRGPAVAPADPGGCVGEDLAATPSAAR